MEKNYFSEETRGNSDPFKYDEISFLGGVWAAIMTLIMLLQLSLF
jgi:hypothetical protein